MGTAEIGSLRVNLAMNSADFDAGAKDAKSELDDLAKRFGLTASNAKIAAAAIAAAFVAAAAAITAGVKTAINQASELQDLAEKFSVPIESLSAFSTEGKVAVDKLSAGLTGLQTAMASVSSGDGLSNAARAFAAIGVAATDVDGKLRPVADVLGDVADKFATYADGANKTALGTAIFGSAFAELGPILNNGTKGMDEFVDAARAAGTQLDGPTAAAAKRVKDNIDALTPSFDSFYQKVAIGVLPVLDKVVQKFVDAADKIHVLDAAVEVCVVAFKSLVSAGIIVQGVFTAIANAAQLTGSILKNIIEGEYTKAIELYKTGSEKANKDVAETIAEVNSVWSKWATTMEETATTHKDKVAAPIIASIQSIKAEQNEWNKSVAAGVALAEKSKTPYEIQAQQLDQLGDAYAAGKISADLLATAQQRAAFVAQNAYAGMASNIAGSLEKVFASSKAVAIASALVNTYESVTKALATYPPPFSYVAAAASLAAGLAQVANIRSTSKTGSGGGGGGGGAAPAAAAGGAIPQLLTVEGLTRDQFLPSQNVKDLANKLLEYQRDGGQVIIK